MKISNSKKELARIISDNGGWRDGAESAAQCINGEISFWHDIATKCPGENWYGDYLGSFNDIEFTGNKLPNWHQTILSREEYYQAYPKADADGWIELNEESKPRAGTIVDVTYLNGEQEFGIAAGGYAWTYTGERGVKSYRLHKPEAKPELCESVMRSIPEPESIDGLCAKVTEENKHQHVDAKPTIEQLAQDYRNAKDYADRKQQEAGEAAVKAESLAVEIRKKILELQELISASKPVQEPDREPELVITDWRDLLKRDVIWFGGNGEQAAGEYSVLEVEHSNYGGCRAVLIDTSSGNYWIDVTDDWRFIRRP